MSVQKPRGWLACAALVILVPVAAYGADESDTAESTIGGTIPELCQLGISNTGTSTLLSLAQDGTGESAFDDGYVRSESNATVLTLDANKAWKLSVQHGGWTSPEGYSKEDDDLYLAITNSPTGTIQNGFGENTNGFDTQTLILNHGSGVSDNTVNIQYQVSLGWASDIPGDYSITVTYTLETYDP